ncbi:MAG: winged helix-turn-helix transcriptional regulator [Clostridia bacterium]|nr:winged helix-turn-helix transcriptional regulator [Clostridia bacterium]MBQ2348143.1 winged helix-turn-helix transcriptional regulator [Clostridia bacterium]MBQ5440252.1 winged helix-turn-helix transcriptional regulator [Clostridia bacterium]
MAIQQILAALSDSERRRIIEILKKGKISSGDLAKELNMTPQALSYHLKKLKQAEIIYETKYKNFIYYELDLTILDELIIWLDTLRKEDHNENKDT